MSHFLFHAHSKKTMLSDKSEYRDPGFSYAGVSSEIELDSRYGRGYADSAWDVNALFITAQWTRSAALKGLTKIIPGSRVENRARAHNTYRTRCNPESMHNVERNRVAAAVDRLSICRWSFNIALLLVNRRIIMRLAHVGIKCIATRNANVLRASKSHYRQKWNNYAPCIREIEIDWDDEQAKLISMGTLNYSDEYNETFSINYLFLYIKYKI